MIKQLFQSIGANSRESKLWVLNRLNWRIVRGLGELQILTKSSYALLVIVPVLAGIWPAVRLFVNHHNRAVRDATILLERSEVEFNQTVERLREVVAKHDETSGSGKSERFQSSIDTLDESSRAFFDQVNNYVADYSERTLRTPLLPWTLAAAFFAALFVVLGHMLYQLAAPDQVRRMTLDEYVVSKKEDFAKHPSADSLNNARTILQSRLGQRVNESVRFESERLLRRILDLKMYHQDWKNVLREMGRPRLRSFQFWLEHDADPSVPAPIVDQVKDEVNRILGTESESSQKDMAVIERAARAEYLQYAVQRRFFTMVTAMLYVLGIVILISIIHVQTTAVSDAAGWVSPFDVLTPPSEFSNGEITNRSTETAAYIVL